MIRTCGARTRLSDGGSSRRRRGVVLLERRRGRPSGQGRRRNGRVSPPARSSTTTRALDELLIEVARGGDRARFAERRAGARAPSSTITRQHLRARRSSLGRPRRAPTIHGEPVRSTSSTPSTGSSIPCLRRSSSDFFDRHRPTYTKEIPTHALVRRPACSSHWLHSTATLVRAVGSLHFEDGLVG